MTVTPFSRIPQPMKGMNYEPAPSDYTTLPPPDKYNDTDFANDDFNALWNDGAGCRGDLTTIAGLGCNTVKLYNWNTPGQRSHAAFLKACAAKGLHVIVPISNFFCGTARANRTGGGNPGPDGHLKGWIQEIVQEVYAIAAPGPGPAVLWAISNEFDLLGSPGDYGYSEPQDIATIAQYLLDAEAALGIAAEHALPFCCPVSGGRVPANRSARQGAPYDTIDGGAATRSVMLALEKQLGAAVTARRFVGSINSYQIGQQLLDFHAAWPKIFPGTPFYYGELGFNASPGAGSSEANQAQKVYSQYNTTVPLSQSGYFHGSCGFEFSDELWKSPPNTSERTFGLYTFDNAGAPPQAHEGNRAPGWGAAYPVDMLRARPVVACFKAALAGEAAPGGCTGP